MVHRWRTRPSEAVVEIIDDSQYDFSSQVMFYSTCSIKLFFQSDTVGKKKEMKKISKNFVTMSFIQSEKVARRLVKKKVNAIRDIYILVLGKKRQIPVHWNFFKIIVDSLKNVWNLTKKAYLNFINFL